MTNVIYAQALTNNSVATKPEPPDTMSSWGNNAYGNNSTR